MDIHKVIGKLPRPKKGFTLPGHKYTGPYNPLDKQLDEHDIPIIGQEPFNGVDEISMRHDICYRDNSTKTGKQKCDDKMLMELDLLEPKNLREKFDKKLVRRLISTKNDLDGEYSGRTSLLMSYINLFEENFKNELYLLKV